MGAVSLSNNDPLVGAVLPGGYQVIDLLGVGGMGRVYRAEQRALGRTVAIKVIHPHLLSDEKSLARFMTEARATSQLNHPNSVSVIDFGKTTDGQPYLVMEFLRGKNLAQVQAAEGPLRFGRIVDVLRQVLMALGEAHDLEMIHRDLKPENIVLEPLRRGGDFVKVVDFGLAKLKATDTPGITLPGIVCGTPDFMAPEQGRGDEIDGRSDLYAVGVVLFWLLTGRLPFESNSPTQVVLMHIGTPVPDPREIAPERQIPDALIEVLYRALSKDAKDRFQDAHEFADALEQCEQETVETRPLAPELPLDFIRCSVCQQVVPHAKYCYDCGQRLPEATILSRPTKNLRLPFLGRDGDLAWLLERWRGAQPGDCVRLVGEPGVGKSRLIEEFLALAQESGARVATISPDPFWAEVSGFGLRSLLEETIGNATRTLPPELEPLQSELAQPSGRLSGPPMTNWRDRYAQLLQWIVTTAAQDSPLPLILVLDDLERIDGLTRQTVEDLLGSSHPGVFVIGAHAPQLEVGWPGEQVRLLQGLPELVATELLHRASIKQMPITLAEVGSRGIPPLYVDQVLAFGLDGGTDPPARLADLIAHRLSSLEPESRRLLQGIAVLGDEVSEDLLATLLDDGVETDDLQHLLQTHLVRRTPSDCLSLVHPLIHELVLLATPAEVRRELHARAVQVFQEHGAPLEVLAEHASLALDSMSALFFLEQVAERAKDRGDDRGATHALSRGLEIAREEIFRGELEDPLRAIAIFGRKLGATLNRRGKYSDAEGVLLETLENTDPASPERLEVLEQLAEAAHHRDKTEDAERYRQQALRIAEGTGLTDALRRLRLADPPRAAEA